MNASRREIDVVAKELGLKRTERIGRMVRWPIWYRSAFQLGGRELAARLQKLEEAEHTALAAAYRLGGFTAYTDVLSGFEFLQASQGSGP